MISGTILGMDSDILGCVFHYTKAMGFGGETLDCRRAPAGPSELDPGPGAPSFPNLLCLLHQAEDLLLFNSFLTVFLGLQNDHKSIKREKQRSEHNVSHDLISLSSCEY